MTSSERQALDRHITGNYGEDQYKDECDPTLEIEIGDHLGYLQGSLIPSLKRSHTYETAADIETAAGYISQLLKIIRTSHTIEEARSKLNS